MTGKKDDRIYLPVRERVPARFIPAADRKLTEQATADIREAVERWKNCPMCDSRTWVEPDHVDGLRPPEHAGTDECLWVFPITCACCGFVALLSLGYVNLVTGRPVPPDPQLRVVRHE